jgi:hypothetical protein
MASSIVCGPTSHRSKSRLWPRPANVLPRARG